MTGEPGLLGVELAKIHLWEEIANDLAGRALRYGRLWGIANKAICWLDDRREVVLRIPITEEQLKLLDTEGLYDDDDPPRP